MPRSLPEILDQLTNALLAAGFDQETASEAVSDTIARLLPSHQSMLTHARELATLIRAEQSERLDSIRERAERFSAEAGDDIPY